MRSSNVENSCVFPGWRYHDLAPPNCVTDNLRDAHVNLGFTYKRHNIVSMYICEEGQSPWRCLGADMTGPVMKVELAWLLMIRWLEPEVRT